MIDLSAPSHYAVLGIAPTATVAEIRKVRDDTNKLLREEARTQPERKAEFAKREQAINAAADVLARPALREEYDQQHPELRLFTVRSAAAPLFTDPAQRISVLRQALVEHLAHSGTPTRPPSDLYRTDFTTDETPNRLLDGLIAQWRR